MYTYLSYPILCTHFPPPERPTRAQTDPAATVNDTPSSTGLFGRIW